MAPPRHSRLVRRSAFLSAVLFLSSGLHAAEAPRSDQQPDAAWDMLVESVSIRGSGAQIALQTRAGRKYDAGIVHQDVRKLYATGRFSDIRVEAEEGDSGKRVTFHVIEAPRLMLGAIRTDPEEFRFNANIPAGTPIDTLRAHSIASEFRRQLSQQGYSDTSVDPELVASEVGKADLVLHVRAGDRVRVGQVTLLGDTGLQTKDILKHTQSLSGKRVLPGIPGLWKGWKREPDYSDTAVASDLARIRSLYLSRGYLDATVRVDHTNTSTGNASVNLLLNARRQYHVRSWRVSGTGVDPTVGFVNGAFRADALCKCLSDLRRKAEREGVLDFSVRLLIDPVYDRASTSVPEVDLVAAIEKGKPYSIRRIDFQGNRKSSDSTIRANLLLHEADLLDSTLLRKSIDRLNRTSLFEPINETSLDITTDEKTGLADVRIRLNERKSGSWSISGPVGPMSLAGSLQFTLASRLPSWGRGLLEMSSWYASFSLLAYGGPFSSLLAGSSGKTLMPVFSLHRPFMPSQSLMSGVMIAPQLGWRGTLAGYGSTQLVERVLPWLSATDRTTTVLPVTVELPDGDATMFCDPARPQAIQA